MAKAKKLYERCPICAGEGVCVFCELNHGFLEIGITVGQAAQKIDQELPIPKADAPATGEGPFAAAELAPAVQYRPQDYAAAEEDATPAAPAARAKARRSGPNPFGQRKKGKL